MYKEFIILPEFDKQWKAMNLTDDDLRRLEDLILENPELGDVMQGTGINPLLPCFYCFFGNT